MADLYELEAKTKKAEEPQPGHKLGLRDLYGVLGEERIKKLASGFYDRVYADKEHPEFSRQFIGAASKESATSKQVMFLMQKFGGPRMYGGFLMDSKDIIEIHQNFQITPDLLQIWISFMHDTMEEVMADLDDDTKKEVSAAMGRWFITFGKVTVNMPDGAKIDTKGKGFSKCPF